MINICGKGRERMRSYPEAYVRYLAEYYGSRDYFECHEIMEEYWKEQRGAAEETCWLVLIRISVALYHARRGNRTGAVKLLRKAASEAEPAQFTPLGIDGGALKRLLTETADRWEHSEQLLYDDLELPLVDEQLIAAAKAQCLLLGYCWGTGGSDVGTDIIHRHLTRDRSEVVSARAASAERKALVRGATGEANESG